LHPHGFHRKRATAEPVAVFGAEVLAPCAPLAVDDRHAGVVATELSGPQNPPERVVVLRTGEPHPDAERLVEQTHRLERLSAHCEVGAVTELGRVRPVAELARVLV